MVKEPNRFLHIPQKLSHFLRLLYIQPNTNQISFMCIIKTELIFAKLPSQILQVNSKNQVNF